MIERELHYVTINAPAISFRRGEHVVWVCMSAASGAIVLTFGVGAILGPLITDWAMQQLGPFAFWLVLAATFGAIALYALYSMTQRSTVPVAETESYLGMLPTASPVAVEAAGAWATGRAESEREAEARSSSGAQQ